MQNANHFTAIVRKQGRVIIPHEIRKLQGIETDDAVDLWVLKQKPNNDSPKIESLEEAPAVE